MAISQIQDSKPTPVSSKDKFQLMQRKTWDAKRMLVKKRLQDLNRNMKHEQSEDSDVAIICYEGKVDTGRGSRNSISDTTSAMERAQEVQANLLMKFPNFLKLMLRSHVSGGFWLGLPKKFCDVHLPKHDEIVVLVDEYEREYDTKYLVDKNGSSGGWRGFSLAHNLMEGDVLVFQLIQPCKFKIYIVRATGLSEADGAIGLLKLEFHDKPNDAVKTEDQVENNERISETKKRKFQDLLIVDNQKDKSTEVLISDNDPAADELGNDSYNFGSETVEGVRFSESVVYFKDVKHFEDFMISVDGLTLDSELPLHLRKQYYKLCRSQKMFLHDNLMYGLNIKLTTGIISEIVHIADAIRAVKFTTSLNDLQSWDKTLKAFEDLGMAVGFLRARIHMIIAVPREYQAVIESKRSEKAEAEDKMRCLKETLLEVETSVKSLDEEIDALEAKEERLGLMISDLASIPW